MELLEVNDLSFTYGNHEVLKNIDLSIGAGEVLCILGPNGCGKTTLLDCILGVHRLAGLQVYLKGQLLQNINVKEKAKLVSYIPQKHKESFPYRVKEIVVMGRAPYISGFGAPKKEDQEIVYNVLKSLNIEAFAEKIYSRLSGGEAQLVMIARALAQETDLLVMDEPTAALDFKNEGIILSNIIKLVKDQNKSILMATHFPNHAFQLESYGVSVKVAMMKDGEIKYYGKPSEVINEKTIQDIYGVKTQIIRYNNKKTKVVQHSIVSTLE